MMNLVPVRHAISNGGHIVHGVPEGQRASLCGFTPKVRPHSKIPSGWYTLPTITDITCPACKEWLRARERHTG